MTEEEGLSWGDDDPTAVATPASRAGVSVKRKKPARASATDDGETGDSKVDPDAVPERLSASLVLVFLGILGGIYLLYTAGWIVAELNNPTDLPQLWSKVLYTAGNVLAVLAPAAWFTAAMLLERRPIQRLVWLVIGVMVLVPWPFLVGRS